MNIALIIIIALIVAYLMSRRRVRDINAPSSTSAHRQPEPDYTPDPVDSTRTVTIPTEYQGLQLAYHYTDVQLVPIGLPPFGLSPDDPVTLKDSGASIDVFCGDKMIGKLPDNRLSGMVRDWGRHGDPYLAFIVSYSDDGNDIVIALAFYSDLIKRFLSRNPDAKLFKLTGKPDDLASPYPGADCSVSYDDDTGKYLVEFDGSILGSLSSSAIAYARNKEIDPEDLSVLVSSVMYDFDREHDVVCVYVAD